MCSSVPCCSNCLDEIGVTIKRVRMQMDTQRVITMESAEGCRVDDEKALHQLSIRPKDVAVLLFDAFT